MVRQFSKRPYGWYPLAPREVYVPSYRHTPHYEQRINREHDPVTVVNRGPAPGRTRGLQEGKPLMGHRLPFPGQCIPSVILRAEDQDPDESSRRPPPAAGPT